VSDHIHVLYADTLDVDEHISDHKGIYVFIDFTETFNSCYKRKAWNYARADFDSLNNLIENTNWDFIETCDVNTSCIQLTNVIYEFMNQCIPSKEVSMRPYDRPGYDSEIRKHTRHRDRL